MSGAKKPTRETVMESAIVAFASKGYAGTSVNDILRVTGLSKPTLYYYFGSKEGLFREILDSAYDGVHAAMLHALENTDTCEKKLSGVAVALYKFTTTHQHLMRLVFSTAFAAPGEIPALSVNPERRHRIFNLVRQVIAQGRKEGALKKTFHADELTQGFFGAVTQQIRNWLFRAEGALSSARATRNVMIFLEGASN